MDKLSQACYNVGVLQSGRRYYGTRGQLGRGVYVRNLDTSSEAGLVHVIKQEAERAYYAAD